MDSVVPTPFARDEEGFVNACCVRPKCDALCTARVTESDPHRITCGYCTAHRSQAAWGWAARFVIAAATVAVNRTAG